MRLQWQVVKHAECTKSSRSFEICAQRKKIALAEQVEDQNRCLENGLSVPPLLPGLHCYI